MLISIPSFTTNKFGLYKIIIKMLPKFILILAIAAVSLASPPVKARKASVLIVGGEEAVQHEFPYLATLRTLGQFACSATIIRNNILVTSAQCAELGPANSLTVHAGKHSLGTAEATEQTRNIASVVIHPGYAGYKNDIAILKTETPFNFNGAVSPLPLAHAGHTATGNATIVGWGSVREDGPVVDILRKAVVPVVTDQTCRESYGVGQIDDNMVCAGFPEGGVDVCSGDAGGPLVARDLGFRYFAGIASFGFGCARPGFPSVYTEIALHIDFITANAS